jgi:hypothetical protein
LLEKSVKRQINFSTDFWKRFYVASKILFLGIFMAKSTKPTKAEEEKKKKAYYAKKEKKAKEVKK